MSPHPGSAGVTVSSSTVIPRLKQLRDMAGGSVFAGVLEAAPYPNGMTPATVLWILEFGTSDGKIPPRPILRYCAARFGGKWVKQLIKLIQKGVTDERALRLMGEVMRGDINTVFSESQNTFAPNAESTQLQKFRDPARLGRKGKDRRKKGQDVGYLNTPLKWTGHMLQSLGYQYVGKAKK